MKEGTTVVTYEAESYAIILGFLFRRRDLARRSRNQGLRGIERLRSCLALRFCRWLLGKQAMVYLAEIPKRPVFTGPLGRDQMSLDDVLVEAASRSN